MSIQIIIAGLTLAEIKNDVAALAASLNGATVTVADTKVTPSGESAEDKAAAKAKADADKAAAKAKKDAEAAAKKLADEKAAAGNKSTDDTAAKLKALRELGMKFVTDQRSAELKEITTKFGIDKVSNCPVERYDELLPIMQATYDSTV